MRAAIAILLALCATADAAPSVRVTGRPPRVEASVIGADATHVTLREADKPPIVASAVRPSTEPIAVALVMNITDRWISDCEDDPRCENRDLEFLAAGLTAARFTGPEDSQIVVVNYAQGAEVRVALSPLATFSPQMLGTQSGYKSIGTDLVQGITLGLAELSKSPAPVKALIVFGDGTDTNNDAARRMLPELRRSALRDQVELFGIIYKSAVSPEGNVLTEMIPEARIVNSADAIARELAAISARLAQRSIATFDLPSGDKDHIFRVQIDGQDYSMIRFAVHSRQRPLWWRVHLRELVIALALLAALVILVVCRRTR